VQRIDPGFFKFRLKPLLEDDGVAAMEAVTCDNLYFVGLANQNDVAAGGGNPEGDELVAGGRKKRVTEKNKKRYVRLLTEHFLVGHCRRELSYLAQGFFDLIPKSVLHVLDSPQASSRRLSALDLELLVCGIPTIDLKEWRENVEGTLSDGHVKETKELAKTLNEETDKEKLGDLLGYLFSVETLLCWFWEIVSEMDTSTQTKLLAFACGTGRLPVDGFRALKPEFRVEVATSEPAEN